jgi:DNA integrity scanning protein DisA with diadenylate cyclase activity
LPSAGEEIATSSTGRPRRPGRGRGSRRETARVAGGDDDDSTDNDESKSTTESQSAPAETVPNTGNAAIDSALLLARRDGAGAMVILAPKRIPIEVLRAIPSDVRLVVGVAAEELERYYREAGCHAVRAPGRFRSRTAQARHAIFQARAAGQLQGVRRVVVISAESGRRTLSTVMQVDLDLEFEEAAALDRAIQRHGGQANVLALLLDVAIEIGLFGIEGHPVGTILVYGATGQVLRRSRQLTFNPYHGYAERSRNIADQDVRESLKIFAQMDGALLIRNDGVIAAAGRYLLVPPGDSVTVRGRGTRHQAAAYITRETRALAMVVSQTSGEVTIFADGKQIFSVSPQSPI